MSRGVESQVVEILRTLADAPRAQFPKRLEAAGREARNALREVAAGRAEVSDDRLRLSALAALEFDSSSSRYGLASEFPPRIFR